MMGLRWMSAVALLFSSLASAEPLSPADREVLLEKLEALREAAEAKKSGKFTLARAAYRSGRASESAALELYLSCVELVQFEKQHKSSQDFREWKRKEDERLKDGAFAQALRHQLNWLSLTLDAADPEADRAALVAQARRAVNSVFEDAERLAPYHDVLKQGVLGSVFAQAYDIKDLELKDWPTSPVQLNEVYDRLVLPELRRPNRLAELRATWQVWIRQEGLMHEHWSKQEDKSRRIGMKDGMGSPAFEKFMANRYPDMQWRMEEDLFRAGDQRDAALRMLEHLDKYVSHSLAPQWVQRFEQLLLEDTGGEGVVEPAAPVRSTQSEPAGPVGGAAP